MGMKTGGVCGQAVSYILQGDNRPQRKTKESIRMRLVITLVLICASCAAHAVSWPMLSNPRIETCAGSTNNPCSSVSKYSADGTVMVDIVPVGSPRNGTGLRVRPMGVHCGAGNALTGRLPFTSCSYVASDHSPVLTGKCELRSLDSWELTSDSTCATATSWGPHRGAGPGGECVVFTNTIASSGLSMNTPMGMIDATQAANGGNRFCSKPLPPSVTCELQLPNVIDHGQMRAGETSKREDYGTVNCGGTPKIDVLVNGDRDVGGVRISATPLIVNQTSVRITSEITVSGSAVPGEHSATYVFVASPY